MIGPELVEEFFDTNHYYDEEVIVSGIEVKIIENYKNTLVCFEMLLMALASTLAFSHKEFLTDLNS